MARRLGIGNSMAGMLLVCIVAGIPAACSGTDAPTAPGGPADVDSVALGLSAFLTSCAACHPPGDGFDIALFGFTRADIIRRGVAHVDSATAAHIAVYIRSLAVMPIGRDAIPFQPGTTVLSNDLEFWNNLVGTAGWPADMTPASLAAMDTRTTPVPVRLPFWSVQADDTDWLPETPLPAELLAAETGLAPALANYHAEPSVSRLVEVVRAFASASQSGPGSICEGEASTHPRARECFEARRWVSALAAMHFLRFDTGAAPPVEIAEVWWETGEVAVTLFFRESGHTRSIVTGWLYLGYSFAPTHFNEDNGYLGQFLQGSGYPRLAAFTALRRLVDPRPVHSGLPYQRFWDANLAVSRAPRELKIPVATFAFSYLLSWLDDNPLVDPAAREEAVTVVHLAFEHANQGDALPEELVPVRVMRDELIARIGQF